MPRNPIDHIAMGYIQPPRNLQPDDSTEPDVLVVCVTYNSADSIELLLAALPAALESIPSCRVVITDNASVDGTPGLIRRIAPWVTLVESRQNLGYAGGINLALRSGAGRIGIYVLNADAVPSPGSISELLRTLEDDPRVGIAVPRIVTSEGLLKFSLRREPTILRALGEMFLGGHRASHFKQLGDMIRDPNYYNNGASADWSTGAAMFISRRAADVVGNWDERFFLYSEETDYALRARDSGYLLRLVPSATVVHPGGEMQVSPRLWSLVATNRTRLYRKRHSLLPSILFWLIVLSNEGTRSLLGRDKHIAAFKALLRLGPNPDTVGITPDLIWRRSIDFSESSSTNPA